MRIGLISDTHIPESRKDLWPQVFEAFQGVDMIMHAGDVHEFYVLDELERVAPVISARGNGEDGLFLCWRVKHGLFEKNILENNGRFGISIGHKDTDNLLRDNEVRSNQQDGIFFRNESEGMAGHRNRLENNVIENNGAKSGAAGIRVRGETKDLVFRNNIIRDTRPEEDRKQSVGIRIEEQAGEVLLEGNQIEATTKVEDRRKTTR